MSAKDGSRLAQIVRLNDEARRRVGLSSFHLGATNRSRLVMSRDLGQLPPEDQVAIWRKIREFHDFGKDDPDDEHRFGEIEHAGRPIYWKIDYYDPAGTTASDDPADPEKTTRVLTITFADECRMP